MLDGGTIVRPPDTPLRAGGQQAGAPPLLRVPEPTAGRVQLDKQHPLTRQHEIREAAGAVNPRTEHNPAVGTSQGHDVGLKLLLGLLARSLIRPLAQPSCADLVQLLSLLGRSRQD